MSVIRAICHVHVHKTGDRFCFGCSAVSRSRFSARILIESRHRLRSLSTAQAARSTHTLLDDQRSFVSCRSSQLPECGTVCRSMSRLRPPRRHSSGLSRRSYSHEVFQPPDHRTALTASCCDVVSKFIWILCNADCQRCYKAYYYYYYCACDVRAPASIIA